MSEVDSILAARSCSVCGGPKREGATFCVTDILALPLRYRIPLTRPNAPEFLDAFRAAASHLAAHSTRRLLVSDAGTANWPYTNLREVADAGYDLVGEPTRCTAPRCGVQILFVRDRNRPDARPFPINRADARPHRLSCADPDYHRRQREERERRRALKTSAPRRRPA